MYKALDSSTNREIVILHPEWRGRLAELRQMTGQARLVCQGCRQAVRVKSGQFRRAHFAHKHLAGCTYGEQSQAVLEMRAVLYDWLAAQFPAQQVTLEKKLEGSLPRPVDCWVETPGGGTAAYWVIDARMRLEARQAIQAALAQEGLAVTWVLAASLLQPDPDREGAVRLSPTERDFAQPCAYDQIGAEVQPAHITATLPADFGGTLHYLDAKSGLLVTCRSLKVVHAPNIYAGRIEAHPLAEVKTDPHSGGFVHPGEIEWLAHSQQALAKLAAAEDRAARRYRLWMEKRERQEAEEAQRAQAVRPNGEVKEEQGGYGVRSSGEAAEGWGPAGVEAPLPAQPAHYPAEPRPAGLSRLTGRQAYPCVTCGEVTEDWWTTFVEDGVRRCRCRNCLREGKK